MLKKIIICTFIFSSFLGINACNKNENIELIPSLSKITLEQISNITTVMKSNPDVGQSILQSINQELVFRSLKNARSITEEIPAELKTAMDEFNIDPTKVLTNIAKETQGADKIALFEGLFTNKDAITLEKRAEVFVPIDLPINTAVGVIPTNSNDLNKGRLDCTFDCKMHVLAGAAVTMGIAAIALRTVTWFTSILKAALLVAVAISAGVMVGAAKEAYDMYFSGGKGTPEWRDFWNTVYGSLAAGAVSWGLSVLITSPLGTTIALGVGSAILGACPAIYFFTKGQHRC